MKVFLSWSGPMSQAIARALHEWLPYVIQQCRPFISSGDISKGIRWNDVLTEELKDAEFGIVCVTPYNVTCPWLNYEAGALTNAIDTNNVSPFLVNIRPSQVSGPIAQFQATVYDSLNNDDIYKLVYSLNGKLPAESQIGDDILRDTVNTWWPKLKDKLDALTQGGDETLSGMPWLLTLQEIIRVPIPPDIIRVFIVTRDLWKHALDRECAQYLASGLEHNVVFEFFFDGDEGDNRNSQHEIVNRFDRHKELLHFYAIESDEFSRQAATDYFIVNPDDETSDHPRRAFIKVPCEDCEHWIKVDEQAAFGFASRFNELRRKELANQAIPAVSQP
jgi:hypothetical protein